MSAAQQVRGQVDSAAATGAVSGWCAAATPPFAARRVTLLSDGVPVVHGILCAIFREDLLEAGVGDGHHGFLVSVPYAFMTPLRTCLLSLVDEATGAVVGQALEVRWPERDPQQRSLEAHIDEVSSDGIVVGWCWDRSAPERRVVLNILVDGEVVGTTIAGAYRDDLRQAGKGSGHCEFSFILPWHAISSRGDVALSLQDQETGAPVGERHILQRPELATAEQRIDSLERQLQLLRGELQAAERRATRQENDRAAPELFRLVADFFGDLAEGKPRQSLAGLRARLDELSARLPLVPLRLPADPQVTLYVVGTSSVEQLHACLSAIYRASADVQARVVVLDLAADEQEDAVLIQAVVRNVQLTRLRPEETLNDILLATPTPYLALVPGHLRLSERWLPELLAALAANPRAAIASSALEGDQGGTIMRCLEIDQGGNLVTPADLPSGATSHADAVDDLALLMRTDTLRAANGLDLSFGNLPAQILDLCVRQRSRGNRLAYHPTALAVATGPLPSLLDQTSTRDMERLLQRTQAIALASAAAPPRKRAGHR